MNNEHFSISEMIEMQNKLQEKYKDKWSKIEPSTGKEKLLWMIGEVGEVIDIIKKNGSKKIMEDEEIRNHFIEEMTDVLMYYNDILNCYGITEKDLKNTYTRKFNINMNRW